MVVNPNIISVNSPKNIGSDLQKVFLEIDSFFGVGRETQSKNYLKFMSKGDESDSADDDEPDFFSCGK
jgi:phage terminase small subunit